jgi:hypothetical protein
MEWLAVNAVNLIVAAIMICGGIVFSLTLDNRLKNIETEQKEIKKVIVISARLEERITYLFQTVLAQGKRLDRVVERVYGRTNQEDECSN